MTLEEKTIELQSQFPPLKVEQIIEILKNFKPTEETVEDVEETTTEETKEEVKEPAVAEKDTTVTAETTEVSEPSDSGDGELVSQEINPGEFQVGMTDEQLDATRNYQKQYENVAKTNEVYSPENDDYEYKFSVNDQGGLDYLTRKKGEEDFIKASDVAEFSIANTFGHLNKDQKKEFEAYQEQLKKIQEEPGTVTLIETDPEKKNLAVRAEDGGFYVPQKELPKASTEDAMKNFEKRTGKKPSSLMELTDEDYIIQDPTLLENSITESLMLQNKQKVVQIRETLRGIKSGFYDVFATTLRIPTYLNEIAFVAMADDKTLELYNSLDVEKRQKVLNKMVGMGLKSQGLPINNSNVVNYLQDISSNFKQKSDAINETMVQYDQAIGELFGESIGYKDGKLDLKGADARKAWDATIRMSAEALKSIPSLVQAVTPFIGITSMIAGQAAGSSLEKQREGEDLSGALNINSLVHGVSEGGLELITRGIAKRAFAAVPKGTKTEVVESVRQLALGIAKDFGLEGLSESATLTVNNLADSWLLDDENAWNGYLKELVDTFLIGGAMGAGISGSGKAFNVLKQNAQANQVNKVVKDADLNNVTELYIAPKATENSIKLSQNPVAKMALDKAVQAQIDTGEISIEKGNEIKNNFRQTEGAVNTLTKLDIGEANQPVMVDLIIEQKNLQQKIKEVDNSSLTKEESARLKEIDSELNSLVTQDRTLKNIKGAEAFAEGLEGVGLEIVKGTEDLISSVEAIEANGGEVVGLAKDEKGNILPAEDQNYGFISRMGDGTTQIILNEVSALKDNVATTAQHEVLHALLDKIFVNNSAAKIEAGKKLEALLNSDGIELDAVITSRLNQADKQFKDGEISEEGYYEEVFTLTSEGLSNDQIVENTTLIDKFADFGRTLKSIFSRGKLNISFRTGRSALDFVKGYNKAIKSGKGADVAAKTGTIKGTETTKQGKARLSEKATRNKKLMQDIVEGDIGAATTIVEENSGLILDLLKFNPDVAQQSGVDSNDILQAVTDMMTPGMVDITFKGRKKSLAEEYAEDKGEVSTFLGRLGVRAAEIYTAAGLDPNKFVTESTSGSEARQIASKKTTTTKQKARARTTPKASRKYPSTILNNLGVSTKAEVDALFEEAIADDIANFYKGEIKEFKDIKDIGPAVAALMEKATGLKANRFSSKTQNIMKGDVESGAVTALQQLLNINADADFAMLAEAANIEGKSTSIPGKILEALFVKNSKGKYIRDTRKGLKDYKDIIDALNPEAKKAKGKDAIYRSADAQALKGLANLSIRNLIFEQAVPDPVARTRTGARFSNKIIKEAVNEVENKGAKKFLEKTLSGNLDADAIEAEINFIEDTAKTLGVDFTDAVDYLFTNEKRYKELRSKFNVRVGGKNEISSAANAVRLKKGYTSLIKGMIPKGKSFSDLPMSFQMALMKTVGFGDARIKIGGKPFTLQEYGLKRGEYGKLMQAVFGKDALIGTGTNLGTRDNVYAPSNWGEKGFRGKVEKIADSYNNGDITLDEARAKVEDLLTPDKETNIDDVLIANQRAVSDTYVSLINMFAADPTNENFATIIDILESQVNRATGIFKGLIPVTSFSIKPEKGTTKGKTANKRMHNEHLVELFNANKNFLNILDKLRKGKITKEKAIFDAKVNAASLEQAVISERMRVEKDADGASVRSFANPLTFLGKDAQFQIPIGIRRLPSGRIFTGTNLAEFIAQELSEKQAKIISTASDASLSPEGIIVKNMINNKSTYQGAKKQNTEMMPGPLGYARASQKQKTNQDIVGELSNLDQALNKGRKIDKPVRKIRVFDFDDTLARSNSKVIVNMPISSIDKDMLDIVARRKFKKEFENLPSYKQNFNSLTDSQKAEVLKEVPGGTKEINATQFAEQAADLEAQGATFDFSQFEKVIDGKKGPLFNVAKKIADTRGTEDLFILTARPQAAAGPIKAFMKALGIDIPLSNITGLGDGTAAAKGRWIAGKAAEGYNDFYFADDASKNVKAVKEVLDQIDVKSRVQQARASKKQTFDTIVNDMIFDSSGIETYKKFSAAKAKTVGANKGKYNFLIPASAEDFTGLLYKMLGKGKKGDAQMAFLKTNLLDPYMKAEDTVVQAKMSAANDFMALKQQFPGLPKTFRKETGIGGFTYQHAIRTYIWTQQGMSIPGLSKADIRKLNSFIKNDPKLQAFADQLISIQKGKPYPEPGKDWLGGNLTTDIIGGINKVSRAEAQQEFRENLDIIFSPENLNKMEAAYGTRWRRAMEDSIRRMKAGTNRPIGSNPVTEKIFDWLNNSVGAVMFLNTRSALLQTISAVNFINWGDNNIVAAGKAFANQKQYWKDFMLLMNSDYLVQRRNGLKINVSESEIADAVKDSKNKPRAAIAFLLSKGFVMTRFADSFAIASGGATFYRNRIKKYIKEAMDQKLAEEKAFDDFRALSEENQQSSDPSKISMQQASAAGRVILAWANTPMQYARIQKRSAQDLIAGRGDWRTHVSKIAYYGFVQNLIFNALQQALFAIGFGDDDEDEDPKKKARADKKIARVANGMIDSQLKGLGIAGTAVSAVKNMIVKLYDEHGKKTPEYEAASVEALGFSPPLNSKYRKLVGGLKSFSWNRKEMKEKGFSLDNPAYLAGAQIISAFTNVPVDRVVKKANNVRGLLSNQTETWQKVALGLGWGTYDIGLPYYGSWDKPKDPTPEEIKQREFDTMKKDTKTSDQVQMLLDLGLDKKQIKALRYEDARVKKIIELQNKKKDGKNKS